MTKKEAKKNKSIYFWTTILLLVLLVLIISQYYTGKNSEVEDTKDLAATVNGEPITLEELDEQFNQIPLQYRVQMTKKDLLDRIINNKLLAQIAKKEGISEEPDFTIIQEEMRRPFTEEEFKEQLEKNGIDYDSYLRDLKTTILIKKYLMKVMPELRENETLVNNTVDQYIELVARENFKARHILVKTKEEAEELRKRILDGEDFAKLAENYSLDPGTAKLGGELGWFKEGQMVEEFEDAVKSMKAGELSEPVKSQFGYHLIQLEERRAGSKVARDDAKVYVEYRLFSSTISRNAKKFLEFVDEKKKNADIKIYYEPKEDDNVIEIGSADDLKNLMAGKTTTTTGATTTTGVTETTAKDDTVTTEKTTTSMATTTTSEEETCSPVYFYYIPGESSKDMEAVVDEMIKNGVRIAKANYLEGDDDCIKSTETVFPQMVCTKNNKVSVGKMSKEEIENFVNVCLG